jgi:4-amino-4-deoxy-L-arabinose transferase-like glycosyltransferase
MIFAIVAAILGYRKAKDTGRNGLLWAFIAVATFIGTQFVVAIVLGLLLGIILGITERPEEEFQMADLAIRALAVILSLVATWLLLRYLDRIPQQEASGAPPPPPENFN